MHVATFTRYAARLEAESSNTLKTKILAEAFSEHPESAGLAALYFQGAIFPETSQKKVSVGPSLARDVIANICGTDAEHVKEVASEVGDTGAVCEELGFGQAPLFAPTDSDRVIHISDVHDVFMDIAEMSGSGVNNRKIEALSNLIYGLNEPIRGSTQVTAEEQAKYLIRLLLDEMRIGVGEGTARDAIVDAFDVSKEPVQRGLLLTADPTVVVDTIRFGGESALKDISLEVGRPVKAMLATKSLINDGVERHGAVVADWKYDGFRAQIHKDGDDVRIFTRRLEDVTRQFPDVIREISASIEAETCIIEGELVGYEPDTGAVVPFQTTSKRIRRKYDIEQMVEEIPVTLNLFEVLYANGEALIDEPLRVRKERLDSLCPTHAVDYWVTKDPDRLREIEAQALAADHEGIMLKSPSSAYTPGNRGKNWLKIKPEVETMDLVVVGGEWGDGRRSAIEVETESGTTEMRAMGSFLLAARDEHSDDYLTIGKVGTGLTDQQLVDLTEALRPHITGDDGTELSFAPAVVWEVGYEEIQQSPRYESGYALRFPRYLGIRNDKALSEVDSVQRVESLLE
jgi:DNA ligase-1